MWLEPPNGWEEAGLAKEKGFWEGDPGDPKYTEDWNLCAAVLLELVGGMGSGSMGQQFRQQ